MGYEEIEHTADVALRCWGDSLADLLVAAAQGLAALIGPATGETSQHHLRLSAADGETLMVDWLSELIYLSERYQESFVGFDVRTEGGLALEATVRGGPIAERRLSPKAATYHGLRVAVTDGVYTATVVFDA